jgi:hypothetical protein
MDFEKGYSLDADSTIADWEPDSNPGRASGSDNGASADQLRTELARKEKLLGQVDTYLEKNIAERIRTADDKNVDAEYGEKLGSGYRKMAAHGDDIEGRIIAIRKAIGIDPEGKNVPVISENTDSVAADAVPVREKKSVGRMFSGFRESIRKIFSGFMGRFSGKEVSDESLVAPVETLPSEKKPVLSVVEKFGVSGISEYRNDDVSPTGWGAIGKASDPYAAERYPRKGGVSDKENVPIEPDAKLTKALSEPSEYDDVRRLRERDRMGYREEVAGIGTDEWLEKRRADASDTKAFGAVSEDRYSVEEIGATRAMGNVVTLKTALEDAERMEKEHPDLAETYAVQRNIAGRAYAEALGVARFALAAELRDEPEGEHRKALMKDFSFVVAELRRIGESPPETSVSEKETSDRRAA